MKKAQWYKPNTKNLKYIFKASLSIFKLFDVNGIKKIDLPFEKTLFER